MSTLLDLAERLARHAHKDQTDRSGAPYISHIERVVANLMRHWPDATDDEVAAAWLHDVIEDTPWDAGLLKGAGISLAAVSIIEEVTRPPLITYRNWIQKLAALGSTSAIKVKLADNEDNISPERVASIPEGESMLRKRYLNIRTRMPKVAYERRALTIGQTAVYSILRDWIKGQVTAVEVGMLSFEGAFLGQILLANGQTVLERVEQDRLLALEPPA